VLVLKKKTIYSYLLTKLVGYNQLQNSRLPHKPTHILFFFYRGGSVPWLLRLYDCWPLCPLALTFCDLFLLSYVHWPSVHLPFSPSSTSFHESQPLPKLCLLVYKALHGFTPDYLSELCIPASSVNYRSHLRSAHQGDLIVPRIRLARYGQRTFDMRLELLTN